METYIIGEIGINANGDRQLALEMIRMAADCGCNAVKFQKRDVLTVYSEEELSKPRASPWGRTTLEQKIGLEFEKEDYDLFFPYAASHLILLNHTTQNIIKSPVPCSQITHSLLE